MWHLRLGIAKKAIAEGRKNLSRALAIFQHYDGLLAIHHSWVEVKDPASGKTLVNAFTEKIESRLADPKPAPRPEQILTATKQVLVNGKTVESFGAENQHDLIIDWLKGISDQGYDAVAELGCAVTAGICFTSIARVVRPKFLISRANILDPDEP